MCTVKNKIAFSWTVLSYGFAVHVSLRACAPDPISRGLKGLLRG